VPWRTRSTRVDVGGAGFLAGVVRRVLVGVEVGIAADQPSV
jgi:hypothetical protein